MPPASAPSAHLDRVRPPAPPPVVDDRVPVVCLVVFLLVWVALAIAPSYREHWLLENLPVFLAVPIGVATFRRFRFSNRAYIADHDSHRRTATDAAARG